MENLGITFADDKRFDAAALGALVVRNDPGTKTWGEARNVDWWVSGAEFNPIANLSRAFGKQTAFLTAMVPNHPLGVRAAQGVRDMGVYPFYKDFQHNGKDGPNIAQTFSDRGDDNRRPEVHSNRANEAAQMLNEDDFDWDFIFGKEGVKIFHTGGLFDALSDDTSCLSVQGARKAKEQGSVCSRDLNWRGKLWAKRGGEQAAQRMNDEIVPELDILLGNEEDFQQCLGCEGPDVQKEDDLDPTPFKTMIRRDVLKKYPNLKVIATTLRDVVSTTHHRWSAIVWANGEFCEAPVVDLTVHDRIGGGDGFAAGLLYGLLEGKSLEECTLLGWAHGALITSFGGDTTMATLDMVEKFIAQHTKGGTSRVDR